MADNNASQIAANIRNAAQVEIPKAVTKGLEKACLVIERDAKRNAPSGKSSGAGLKGSITHEVQGDTGIVKANAPYSAYVEAGTGIYATMGSRAKKIPWHWCDAEGNWHTTYGMVARPFLKPARDNNLSAIMRCFEGLI